MKLFTDEKELVTIVNFTVHKHTLNINLNTELTCSIVQIYANSDIKPRYQYIVNNDKPNYVGEEVKSEHRSDKTVTVVCYRPSVTQNRLLESTSHPITLSIEYISNAVDTPKDDPETVLVIPEDPQENGDTTSSTNPIHYLYIFLGAILFVLFVFGIVFIARRWNKRNGNKEGQSKNRKIVNSSSSLENNDQVTPNRSNPYQMYPK